MMKQFHQYLFTNRHWTCGLESQTNLLKGHTASLGPEPRLLASKHTLGLTAHQAVFPRNILQL